MIRSKKSKFGDIIFIVICVLVTIICLTPMLNLAARSLSGSKALIDHKVYLWPKDFNVDAYVKVFTEQKYVVSFFWTVFLTVVCTLLSLFMTTICAYPLIFPQLKGRAGINIFITITMFFNAGIMPNFILMTNLHLVDNPLVLILPGCLSVYNMIIMRSFFYGIPDSLRESAEIDGANFFVILWKIYLPLSKPVLATLALFYAVGRWNGYSDALMYMFNAKQFYPLQTLLYNIVKASENPDATKEGVAVVGMAETVKAAIIMFATVPILVVYPFLQRYFIHGVTLGAVKE